MTNSAYDLLECPCSNRMITKRPPRRLQPSGGMETTCARGDLMSNGTESWHGTGNGYNHHGCRCPECTEANRVAGRNRRARMRAKGGTPEYDGTEPWHGTSSGYGHHRCRCEKCRAFNVEALREYRAKNPDRDRDYQREYLRRNAESVAKKQRAYRLKRRDVIAAHKERPCADCGVQYPPYVMQFDHRDPSTKEFTIADRAGLGLEQIIAEIAKCDVVCANCHMERTHGDAWRKRRDLLTSPAPPEEGQA